MSNTTTEPVRQERRVKKPPIPAMSKIARRTFELFARTAHWTGARAEKLTRFYLVPHSEGFHLYVISRAQAYDFDLGDELADFSREMSRSIPVMATLLTARTTEDLRAHFDPDAAFGALAG